MGREARQREQSETTHETEEEGRAYGEVEVRVRVEASWRYPTTEQGRNRFAIDRRRRRRSRESSRSAEERTRTTESEADGGATTAAIATTAAAATTETVGPFALRARAATSSEFFETGIESAESYECFYESFEFEFARFERLRSRQFYG